MKYIITKPKSLATIKCNITVSKKYTIRRNTKTVQIHNVVKKCFRTPNVHVRVRCVSYRYAASHFVKMPIKTVILGHLIGIKMCTEICKNTEDYPVKPITHDIH